MITRCDDCENKGKEMCYDCTWRPTSDKYKRAKSYMSATRITLELLHELLNLRDDIEIKDIAIDQCNDVAKIAVKSSKEIKGITFEKAEGEPVQYTDFDLIRKAKTKNARNFHKGDIIEARTREEDNIFRKHICICVDEENAVFAPYIEHGKHTSTLCSDLIIYPNDFEHKPDRKYVRLISRAKEGL